MAGLDKGGETLGQIITIVLILAISGIAIFFVFTSLNKGQDAADKGFAQLDSVEMESYAKYNNTEVKGQEILSLASSKQSDDFGLIVVTKKEGAIANGHNYIRPIGASVTDAGTETPKMPGVYKNTLTGKGLGSKDEWDAASFIEGSFASDDPSIRSNNYKYAKKSGHKSQIVKTALFECKLILDSQKVIGTICIQKGVL